MAQLRLKLPLSASFDISLFSLHQSPSNNTQSLPISNRHGIISEEELDINASSSFAHRLG